METKRCAYCHKLVRADAQVCGGCGHTFVHPKTRPLQRGSISRSVPPASPHQAGHYSGLHPEDQPYESSMIAVQRPPAQAEGPRRLIQGEPEHIVLPLVAATPPSLSAIQTEHTEHTVASQPTRLQSPRQRASALKSSPLSKRSTPDASAMPARRPVAVEMSQPSGVVSAVARKRRSHSIIPLLLALSCVFFLLASTILAFVLIGNQPTLATASLQVAPDLPLRVGDAFHITGHGFGTLNDVAFTYDTKMVLWDGNNKPLTARTDAQGAFAIVVRVPANWAVGDHYIHATDTRENLSVSAKVTVQQTPTAPPHLQLAQPSSGIIDLGDGRAGTTAKNSMTLLNTGGGQISWHGHSDASWLSITPNNDTFNGTDLVTITGNRGGLTPNAYTGHITFTQQNNTTPIIVTVKVKVNPEPAALTVSTSALTFSTPAGQAISPYQSVTLLNSGGQTLNWGSSVSTTDGANWLIISQTSGSIEPGQNQVLTVAVQPLQLAAGQYQGAITFTGGANAQVNVALNVIAPIPPGNLIVSLSSLTFNAIAGQSTTGKIVTLQNTGGSTLSWAASTVTANKGGWLNSDTVSGTLDPGMSKTVSVSANAASLVAGVYQGTITFSANGVSRDVSVVFTVAAPPQPAISTQTTPLTFSVYKGQAPAPRTFTLSNTGNAPLNWAASEDNNGASFAPVSPAKGLLAAGSTTTLTVSPNITGAAAGVLATTITIADTDTGATVASQKIAVSITILDQPNLAVDSTTLSLSASSSYPTTSTLFTISNSGTQNLNWVITPDATAAWLTFDISSGVVAPGQSQVVNVQCNSSQLTPGTYKATFTVGDSDTGTTVVTQTIHVTFVVS